MKTTLIYLVLHTFVTGMGLLACLVAIAHGVWFWFVWDLVCVVLNGYLAYRKYIIVVNSFKHWKVEEN